MFFLRLCWAPDLVYRRVFFRPYLNMNANYKAHRAWLFPQLLLVEKQPILCITWIILKYWGKIRLLLTASWLVSAMEVDYDLFHRVLSEWTFHKCHRVLAVCLSSTCFFGASFLMIPYAVSQMFSSVQKPPLSSASSWPILSSFLLQYFIKIVLKRMKYKI